MEDIQDQILSFSDLDDISLQSKSISSNGSGRFPTKKKRGPNDGSKRIITFGPNAIGERLRTQEDGVDVGAGHIDISSDSASELFKNN